MAPGLILEGSNIAVGPYSGFNTIERSPSPALDYHTSTRQVSQEDNRLDEKYSTVPDDVHDLVCVGFGPASLAIAVALHDKWERESPADQQTRKKRVRFLEKQDTFKWHSGMLLPGTKMQISFIKDLATLRDPRSRFTFLSYLKEKNRLAQFSNLGTFLPSRVEFEDYMRWAASHFDDVVDYSQQVQYIRPVGGRSGEKHEYLEIRVHDIKSDSMRSLFSKNVVVAVGGQPSRPEIFPWPHTRILHSSEYNIRISKVLPSNENHYKIAVIGSGQSAAEIFHNLHSRYPNASTRLILRDTALRPSDDSPFVNEVFNPEAVDEFFEQPPEVRCRTLQRNKATNYSVVRLELLEKIYEEQYLQSVQEPDRSRWHHQILTSREIIDVASVPADERIQLTLRRLDEAHGSESEKASFDAVILATGYRRDAHAEILKECRPIIDKKSKSWCPGRDYALQLDRFRVSDDVNIWLQGCNEETHGLSDTLLSILATRAGELVQSIFGETL